MKHKMEGEGSGLRNQRGVEQERSNSKTVCVKNTIMTNVFSPESLKNGRFSLKYPESRNSRNIAEKLFQK